VTPIRHAGAVEEEDRGRSAERLVTFTDAVVAIAVTLLALPLADIPHEFADRGMAVLLQEATSPLLGFAISFFVIARLWWAHHRIFAHVVRWDRVVVVLTVIWLFTIVLLAPVTALPESFALYEDPAAIAIYIGTITISSALLTALSWYVRRHAELTEGHDTGAGQRLFNSAETTIGFALALVIGTTFPQINYFAIFTIVITGQIGKRVWRRRARALHTR
jgi:uncharacterized membrane protein